MAPSKRTATVAGPNAKAAKTEQSKTTDVMPGGGPSATDECAPALALLSLAHELPDAYRQSLAAMVPLCLNVPKEKRDPYQQSMADAIVCVATDVHAQHRAAIDKAKDSIAEAERELGLAAAAVAEARKQVATRSAECDTKKGERTLTEAAICDAPESAERKRARLDNLRTQRAATAADRTTLLTLVSETLPLLRMGTMVGDRGSRPKLKKMIDSVATVLAKLDVEKSFVEAVSAMFWLKPDDRSAFAKKVLTSTEEAVAKHFMMLEARLGDLERECAEEETAHVEAVAAAISAPKRHEECMEEYLAMEIELMEAETALHKAEDAEMAMKHEAARRMKALECAIQQLGVVQTHFEKFEAQRQRDGCTPPTSSKLVNAEVSSEQHASGLRALAPSAGA